MSRAFRPLAWIRWLAASESLPGSPPEPPAAAPPPPSGLRRFFLRPDEFPDPTAAPPLDPSTAARPTFWRWLSAPERLPKAAAAEPPRAES